MTESDSAQQTQPPVQPMYPAQPGERGTDPLAIVSLVTGICGIVLWLVPVLGFLSATAGVVTGIINLYQKRTGQGLAIAGLITGGIGVIGNLLFWGFVIVAIVGLVSSGPSSTVSTSNLGLYVA